MAKKKHAVDITREEDFPLWYQEVIKLGDLAEHSAVRGCMVIKPRGYAIWERMQRTLDDQFKARDVQNAYFPLFIPLEYLEREAEHVEGFAKECAIVTHTRLEQDKNGKLIPAGKLEEPLIVRPTSETIIGESFAKWVQSYRDLPLKINQWCNVVRWEMRPRLFLRTAEILWQEGHTVHASSKEAKEQALEIQSLYAAFAQEYLAIPVIKGEKSEGERFPGAENTYTFEAMMQDGKALQLGTSHYMGQNFSKAGGIKFLNKTGKEEYGYTTSWGVTTRMIGALLMTHGDDNGVIIPPRIAAKHVAIIPILTNQEKNADILAYCEKLKGALCCQTYFEAKIGVDIIDDDRRAGEKAWDAIKKGYPVRIEIGARDIESGKMPLSVRTKEKNEKDFLSFEEIESSIEKILDQIHVSLFNKASLHRKENTISVNSLTDFEKIAKSDDFPGKFIKVFYGGDKALEDKIQKDYGVTIRCIPNEQPDQVGPCIFGGKNNPVLAIFAKSY
ncbi:MAG: Proline--tRNA ligase [Chlamydiia bacterium]|nr:Proline--tRNA ligase [Chlamydiia bacterium]MCH9618739.1 Proline--tRNA ligase [Chlamydiia bacterium]MCH9624521.1 Proline--tRNA ligase [Chlamydiia bacterium]